VIDHICRGQEIKDIEKYMQKMINTLEFYGLGGSRTSESKKEP
jgi:hypothetical protein